MGHLTIYNQNTINNLLQTRYVSGTAQLGPNETKTIADIFSSFLTIRRGDWLFPWIVSDGNVAPIGFKYAFKADGSPIYVRRDQYPIKIPVKRDYIEFNVPLSEEQALDLFDQPILWNAIGKKSLGRSRSLTPQTPYEDARLFQLLRDLPNQVQNNRRLGVQRNFANSVPITINPGQVNPNYRNVGNITRINPNVLPWSVANRFKYEKALEAWFVENLDGPACHQFWQSLINAVPSQFIWFGNYLTFGVAGKNIDIVVEVIHNNVEQVYVIELKREHLSQNEYARAVDQVLAYSDFILTAYEHHGRNITVHPVVLSADSNPRGGPIRLHNVPWMGYEIDQTGTVNFQLIV